MFQWLFICIPLHLSSAPKIAHRKPKQRTTAFHASLVYLPSRYLLQLHFWIRSIVEAPEMAKAINDGVVTTWLDFFLVTFVL